MAPVVLVVEDDEAIADALMGVLEQEGYGTASVPNGERALAWLASHPPPALILLDLMMPVMDGWEFRRRQLADPALSGIPTIVLTAGGVDSQDDLIRDMVIVRKPLGLDHLLRLVRQRAVVPPRYEHGVFLYDDPARLGERVATFLAEGLARDEVGVVLARPAHRAAILRGLEARELDVASLHGSCRILLHDAADVLARIDVGGLSERRFREFSAVVDPRRRGRAVRVYGEVVDLLCEAGRIEQALDLETFWNQVPFDPRDFRLLCGYRQAYLRNAADVSRVCDHHVGLFAA